MQCYVIVRYLLMKNDKNWKADGILTIVIVPVFGIVVLFNDYCYRAVVVVKFLLIHWRCLFVDIGICWWLAHC
jgi:hypothetical protein